MSLLVGIFLGGVLFAFLYQWKRERDAFYDTKGIPGSFGYPLAGNSIEFIKSADGFVRNGHRKYGEIFKAVLPSGKAIVVTGSELLKQVLNSQRDNGVLPGPGKVFGSGSILCSNDKIHKTLRSVALQSMSTKALQSFQRPIFESTKAAIESMVVETDDRGLPKTFLDAYPILQKAALQNSIAGMVGKLNLRDISNDELFRYLEDYSLAVMSVPIDLPFTQFGKGLKSKQIVVNKIKEEIAERRAQPGFETKYDDILQTLLLTKSKETGEALTETQILDTLSTFLFASQDTTAATMSQVVTILGTHPHIQERAKAEVLAADKQLEDMTYEEMTQKLPYCHGIVKEGLRTMGPIGFTFRTINRDLEVTTSNGTKYVIPKNYACMISLKYNMEIYNGFHKPEEIDPSRYLEPRNEDKFRYGFVPFSVGQRSCPGAYLASFETLILTALVCSRFKVHIKEEPQWIYTFGPRPANGIRISLTKT